MQESPAGSFMRFFLGFVIFVGLSVGLTVYANSVTARQAGEQRAAAALSMMLEQHVK